MDSARIHLQRSIDGRLDRLGSAALDRAVQGDGQLAREHAQQQQLDRLLKGWASDFAAPAADQAVVDAVSRRIAGLTPARVAMRISVAHVALGMLAILAVGLSCALAGSLRDLLPLGLLALLALISGLVLISLARSLHRLEESLLRRILARPFLSVGGEDVLLYRTVGVALVIGGLWLTWKSF